MTDDLQSFSRMLRQALGDRLAPGGSSFVDMFAANGVMEFPYALPGDPERVEGPGPLGAYLAALGERLSMDRIGRPTVIEAADPGTVILEFEGFGHGTRTGEPYEQRYLAVIRTRGGRIVHYKDYWNPLALLRATRGPQVVAALAEGGAGRG